ncbi:MAG: ferredoxin:glutaredoxin reductase [Candidatus Coatesbacteria bacterium]|nr:ferredoxin:glutaredoxin reductase [Candidatus Coatesbacteria bacterium]
MREEIEVTQKEIDDLFSRMEKESREMGYFLNPDREFTEDLIRSLLINEKRYGYMNCPCRLSSRNKEDDLDIICPCDYRDADIVDYDACFCGLFVSSKIFRKEKLPEPIPERRPSREERKNRKNRDNSIKGELSKPVWRCKVCGYLCGRDNPPEICPICKAKGDRFERFI